MVVVDTSVVAALLIQSPNTELAVRLRRRDPEWVAPRVWRSEFRSVLRKHILFQDMAPSDAAALADAAERMMQRGEFAVASPVVLDLVSRTRHSSYDCEFVALAMDCAAPLITTDRKLVKAFPDTAIALADFATA